MRWSVVWKNRTIVTGLAMFCFVLYISTTCHTLLGQSDHLILSDGTTVSRSTLKGQFAYVELRGRIGNNLFQLASVYGLSRTYHHIPVYYAGSDIHTDYQQLFPHLGLARVQSQCAWNKISGEVPIIHEEYISSLEEGVGPVIETVPYGDAILCCYIQPKENFMSYREDILRMFTFNQEYQGAANRFLLQVRSESQKLNTKTNLTYVGIHVRRGDMDHPSSYKLGYRLPNSTYFLSAMEYYERKYKNVVFIVATDGKDWVRTRLALPNVYVSEFEDGQADLALMAACNHTISSTGTFTWWVNFLTRGETVAFRGHIDPSSSLGKRGILKARFMPNWIVIDQDKKENDRILKALLKHGTHTSGSQIT